MPSDYKRKIYKPKSTRKLNKKAKAPIRGLSRAIVLKATHKSVHERANDVFIKRIYPVALSEEKYPELFIKVMSRKPTTGHKPPVLYTVIRVLPTKKLWFSCNCEDFTFKSEYALTKHGASSIMYSNGC